MRPMLIVVILFSPRTYNPIYFLLNVFTMAIGNITVGGDEYVHLIFKEHHHSLAF